MPDKRTSGGLVGLALAGALAMVLFRRNKGVSADTAPDGPWGGGGNAAPGTGPGAEIPGMPAGGSGSSLPAAGGEGGALLDFVITVAQGAAREVMTTGQVANRGNVAMQFRVTLLAAVRNAGNSHIANGSDLATVTLEPGQTSAPITLATTPAVEMLGNWTIDSHVTLDRISPAPTNGIAATAPTRYTEPVILDAGLVGF